VLADGETHARYRLPEMSIRSVQRAAAAARRRPPLPVLEQTALAFASLCDRVVVQID
jgi:hypothetical protein